jgi:hypothetical protein
MPELLSDRWNGTDRTTSKENSEPEENSTERHSGEHFHRVLEQVILHDHSGRPGEVSHVVREIDDGFAYGFKDGKARKEINIRTAHGG